MKFGGNVQNAILHKELFHNKEQIILIFLFFLLTHLHFLSFILAKILTKIGIFAKI